MLEKLTDDINAAAAKASGYGLPAVKHTAPVVIGRALRLFDLVARKDWFAAPLATVQGHFRQAQLKSVANALAEFGHDVRIVFDERGGAIVGLVVDGGEKEYACDTLADEYVKEMQPPLH